MRIVGGSLKGRSLYFESNKKVRPLTQKAKESLFTAIGNQVIDAHMADLFCGSGSVGIEAISRGAQHVDFVDLNTRTVSQNFRHLHIASEQATILRRDIFKALDSLHNKGITYDIIFLGPPYPFLYTEKVMEKIDALNLIKPEGLLFLEHEKRRLFPNTYTNLACTRVYTHGQTLISRYEPACNTRG